MKIALPLDILAIRYSAWDEVISFKPFLKESRERLSELGILDFPQFLKLSPDWRSLELPLFANLHTLLFGLNCQDLGTIEEQFRSVCQFPLNVLNCGIPPSLRHLMILISLLPTQQTKLQSLFPWTEFDAHVHSKAQLTTCSFMDYRFTTLPLRNLTFQISEHLPLLHSKKVLKIRSYSAGGWV